MSQLPLHIDTHDRRILVVGGGSVACRKLRTLLAANASVRVVSPVMNPELLALSASGAITARTGYYQESDLEGVFLAVAATNDTEVNSMIAKDARQRGILVTVVDAPALSTCAFPAMLRRGNLEISVATGGRCPAFAALVRDILSTVISDGYGIALEQLALEREKLLTEGNSSTYNKRILRAHAICLINELNEQKERVP